MWERSHRFPEQCMYAPKESRCSRSVNNSPILLEAQAHCKTGYSRTGPMAGAAPAACLAAVEPPGPWHAAGTRHDLVCSSGWHAFPRHRSPMLPVRGMHRCDSAHRRFSNSVMCRHGLVQRPRSLAHAARTADSWRMHKRLRHHPSRRDSDTVKAPPCCAKRHPRCEACWVR